MTVAQLGLDQVLDLRRFPEQPVTSKKATGHLREAI
jgi:hypothetical protein